MAVGLKKIYFISIVLLTGSSSDDAGDLFLRDLQRECGRDRIENIDQ